MAGMRAAIAQGRLSDFCDETRAAWAKAEAERAA
jgi:queuine tRNA-ribosyltransferase